MGDISPDYRPDGNRIVYSGLDAHPGQNDIEIFTTTRVPFFFFGIDQLWLRPQQLTFNNTDDLDPAYSPDGNKIVYAGQDTQPGQSDWEIFTMDLTTGTRVQVTNNNVTNDLHPSWQPQ